MSYDVTQWRKTGAPGFFAFIDDVRPMIPSSKGGFEPFIIQSDEIKKEIEKALDPEKSTLVFCWPRRHGKTVIVALIIVWRFLSQQTQEIAIVANSERQTVDTAFRLVRTILEQTPYMRGLVDRGAIKIAVDKIEFESLGNRIQGFSANPAALFGKKLSVAQVSELHAASSDGVYQAVASSTIDTDDGIVLVDSTVGPRSSPLYGLYSLAKNNEDPTIAFSHVEYRDLDDAIENGPRWISPQRLRSRAKQMLPQEFAQQHLNQWASGSSALFPPAIIEKCSAQKYPFDISAIADGRAYAVGSGLDRAYGFSLHGDATVTCCVMKVVSEEQENYYVMADDAVKFSSAAGIKNNFERYRVKYQMSRATIESYNAQDIQAWASDQSFESETVFATTERQSNAFTALYNAASEGRLHIHPRFKKLLSEMETFEYRLEASKGKTMAKFEHAKGCHDDHVYALAWAVYSLRDIELNPYELKGIWCDAPTPVARLCILGGGNIEPPCSNECRSFQQLVELHELHNKRKTSDKMVLNDFYMYKVHNIGTRTVLR